MKNKHCSKSEKGKNFYAIIFYSTAKPYAKRVKPGKIKA